MVPAVAWVMGAWRGVRIVPALGGAGTACPAMSVAGLSRRYRVMPGGIRWVAGRLYLGRLVPTLYRCRALVWAPWPGAQGRRQLRGKVRMMADVACFCGCVYSFDGHAGACPGCGEVATLTVGRASAGTEHGQQEQPGPAANGHRRGGQAATLREWAELIPVPRPAIAMSDSTSRAGTGRENRP
jgi:hypothetical protein